MKAILASMRIVVGLLAVATLMSPLVAVHAQAPGGIDLVSFDRADRRARKLLWSIRCAQSVSMARARGEFGPPDSLGRIGQCVFMDGRSVGVFFDADTTFARATRFSAVELGSHARRTAPMDTAAVLAIARAELAAQSRGAGAFQTAHRPYAPMAFRFDGDSIEVWLIPASLVMGPPFTLGGERGYLVTPDGRTFVRETDGFGDYRPTVVPDTGIVHIVSRATSVPSLSEMVLANGLSSAGRSVSIEWAGVSSVLGPQGEQSPWVHLTRRP
jgi:hypothetical protein